VRTLVIVLSPNRPPNPEIVFFIDRSGGMSGKHKIPNIRIDHSLWDRGWEKTLRTLSASEDVFPVLRTHWEGEKSIGYLAPFAGMSDSLCKSICRFQEVVVRFEEHLEETCDFVATWLLLGEAERKRHLFNGMKETCEFASLHNDGRALCPEITTTAFLKQNGKAFTDFARAFVNLLPSDWWSSAVSMPEPWPEDIRFVFTQLSLQRNEFIGTAYRCLFTFCPLFITLSLPRSFHPSHFDVCYAWFVSWQSRHGPGHRSLGGRRQHCVWSGKDVIQSARQAPDLL
jgi:hypothetical protein